MDLDSLSRGSKKKSKKEKKEKKSKKTKKNKKHKKKIKEASSSSSSSDSEASGNEWVEKGTTRGEDKSEAATSTSTVPQRDEWMTAPCMFACVTRDQLRAAKQPTEKKKEEEASKYMLDRPGQSGRELNPYWANNGTGLPSERPPDPESLSLNANTVGDQGVSWLRRALKRAQEQAEESGRTLEEVAAERWGSLQKLEDLLSEAEGRKVNLRQNRPNFKKDHQSKYGASDKHDHRLDRRNDRSGVSDSKYYRRDERYYLKDDKSNRGNNDYGSDKGREEKKYLDNHTSDRKYDVDKSYKSHDFEDSRDRKKDNDVTSKSSHASSSCSQSSGASHSRGEYDSYRHRTEMRSKLDFKKPEENNPHFDAKQKYNARLSGRRSWKKSDVTLKQQVRVEEQNVTSRRSKSKSPSSASESESHSENENIISPAVQEPEILSDQQLNELAAKLVKAEILGNDELVAQLQKKLETARQIRAANPNAVPSSSKTKKSDAEVIVLSHTDSKGFSRPLQTKSVHPEPVGGRRKKQNVETHSADGQRDRYFPDDDKYSLKEMFQKEKLTTVEDQNEMFTKLAGKDGRQEHDYDMDDIFSERARQKESDGKIEARERGRAIQEHKRKERVLDSCKWCFDGKELQRHLIVAAGSKAFICLPPYQSLTEGHCLIVPLSHITCSTQLDEDVWEEIQDFRKALVRMFAAEEEDCVLFESAMYLNKFPHMVLHCVPLPREIGDMAPIYFKKAILECETEWSTNKKLVDLSKKDIRRSVPKGLPYFSVDFGNEGGFAHVIEEEKSFPTNFAQEIIGGMLDLDHNIWRKPRIENFDKQRRKVIDFAKKWRDFDFTKDSHKAKRMKTEDADSSESS